MTYDVLLFKYMEHVALTTGAYCVDNLASDGGDQPGGNPNGPAGPYFSDSEQSALRQMAAFIQTAGPARKGRLPVFVPPGQL